MCGYWDVWIVTERGDVWLLIYVGSEWDVQACRPGGGGGGG